MTNVPGLPPTALQMQMTSLNEQYEQSQALGAQLQTGGQPQTGGPLTLQQPPATGAQPAPGAPQSGQYAQSSLQDMAEKMASQYGLNFSRGSLVDSSGNFVTTPDQLAGLQQGGDVGDTAAQMNYIAQAINDQRVKMQQDKATAALQAGAGLLQKRGRGSLAALQSNFYQAMAQNYTDPNLLPEQQDFSFWIQKEQMDIASLLRQKENADLGLNGGGGGSSGGGFDMASQPTAGDPYGSTDFTKQGTGDVVTSGPHAGQVPTYTYDPINQSTTISWGAP